MKAFQIFALPKICLVGLRALQSPVSNLLICTQLFLSPPRLLQLDSVFFEKKTVPTAEKLSPLLLLTLLKAPMSPHVTFCKGIVPSSGASESKQPGLFSASALVYLPLPSFHLSFRLCVVLHCTCAAHRSNYSECRNEGQEKSTLSFRIKPPSFSAKPSALLQ